MINGIHHVAIKYNNIDTFEKALDFYCNILGLRKKVGWGKDDRRAVLLDAGGGGLELYSHGGAPEGSGSANHFALATEKVDECIEAVRAAGYQITTEPKDVNLGGIMPARIAFCIGPGGEEIEFFHELSFDA